MSKFIADATELARQVARISELEESEAINFKMLENADKRRWELEKDIAALEEALRQIRDTHDGEHVIRAIAHEALRKASS